MNKKTFDFAGTNSKIRLYLLSASIAVNGLLVGIIGFQNWPVIKDFFIKKYIVVMFGDSMTANGSWTSLLGKSNIKTSGNRGFTTSHLVWLVKKQVISYTPRICYLQGGSNDIGVGIPFNRTCNNFASLVDTLQKYHVTPVVESTIFTVSDSLANKKIDSLNFYLIQLCQTRHIKFVNLNKKLSLNGFLEAKYSSDGIHLNESGYKVWANALRGD